MTKFRELDLKGIFIDFDGTLIDSSQAMYQIYCSFLQRYGYKGTKQEFNELNGPSLEEIIETLGERYKLIGSPQQLKGEYEEEIARYYKTDAYPFLGAVDCLNEIHKTSLSVVLVTSAPKSLVTIVLDKFKLTEFFDHIVTAELVKQSKPHPAIYLAALEITDFLPTEAIAIEDSANGVESASKAGIYAIRLKPGFKKLKQHAGWAEGDWDQIKNLIMSSYHE